MKRRKFLLLLGAASAAGFDARAQQPMLVVGFLGLTSPDSSAHGPFAAALRQGLADAGFVEGRNMAIESRWAHGNINRLPELAADLAGRGVAVIATMSAKQATTTVPVVFTSGGDPIQLGLVDSFNRPGGNVTGISVITGGSFAKRLEILREMVPGAAVIGLLVNPSNPNVKSQTDDIIEAARILNQRIVIAEASDASGFEPALADLGRRGAGAMLVYPDASYTGLREQLVAAAARHELPAIYHFREFAAAGGLMSYGANFPAAFRLAGGYVARVLKGEKPADLPVQQPTTFELVINLKTAKSLRLAVPPTMLARADEVIE